MPTTTSPLRAASRGPLRVVPVPGGPAARHAWPAPRNTELTAALARAISRLPDRSAVPCLDPDLSGLWTSESRAEHVRAERLCGDCPVRPTCAAAGRREHGGVWGGRLRQPKK